MSFNNNQEVHAPYHFVPLSKWVYMPDWAHLVSHDHPFEDGYSGVIDYTLINATPLCVGGEQSKAKDQATVIKWSKDPKGNPVIQGSSMKGMLRSVLDIVSFSKFSAVDEGTLFYRDFINPSYKTKTVGKEVQACWLKFDDKKSLWILKKCKHTKLFHDDFNQYKKSKINNSKHGYHAINSYKKFGLDNKVSFDIKKRDFKIGCGNDLDTYRAIDFGYSKVHEGHVVFSSYRPLVPIKDKNDDFVRAKTSSDKRVVRERTNFSYIFYDAENEIDNVHEDVINSFFSSQQNEMLVNDRKINVIDYYIENQNIGLGIPVFALCNKSTNHIEHLGLSKLPRIKYKNSIADLVKLQNNANQSDSYFDLSELMFGTLRESGLSLKSRVSFTDATCEIKQVDLYKSNALVLNGPKPTFYPAYLEQVLKISKNKKYNDYDDNSIPAGRKRYISKDPVYEKLTQFDLSNNEKISSRMELTAAGTKFEGKIVFHNLKAEELGALIWIIKLGGNADSFHSLGHGKPYGAGAVQISPKITILNQNTSSSEPLDENGFMQEFTKKMEFMYPFDESWSNSPQLKYLHALSNMYANFDINTSYMSLANKDYQNAKKAKSKLEQFNGIERFGTAYEKHSVSSSFGKGRLSHLLDQSSSWEKEQIEMQSESISKTQERVFKIKEQNKIAGHKNHLKKEKKKLEESDLSPYEKSKSFLSLIVEDQCSLTKTEQKKKVTELREILKELKIITITTQEAMVLIEIYTKIMLSKKETEKAIKYLGTL